MPHLINHPHEQLSEGGTDGHRKSIVEHTIHILFLPGLHAPHTHPQPASASSTPASQYLPSHLHPHNPSSSSSLSLPAPFPSLLSLPSLPSPLHLRLHLLTRLSFNDAGLITHHRDVWDVRDALGLVPGVSLVQWVASRMAAQGLSWAARALWGGARAQGGAAGANRKGKRAGMRVRIGEDGDGDVERGESMYTPSTATVSPIEDRSIVF